MAYLGIDPGLTGGLALVNGAGLLQVKRMSELCINGRNPKLSGALLAKWLQSQRAALHTITPEPILVFLELAQAFPDQGSASGFNYGTTFGIVIGTVEALGFPLAFVAPVKWKKDLGLIRQPKDASRQLCIRTWPERADWFDHKYDCGVADAACIAEWARTRPSMPLEGPRKPQDAKTGS